MRCYSLINIFYDRTSVGRPEIELHIQGNSFGMSQLSFRDQLQQRSMLPDRRSLLESMGHLEVNLLRVLLADECHA